jgi:hypothetical protein
VDAIQIIFLHIMLVIIVMEYVEKMKLVIYHHLHHLDTMQMVLALGADKI